LSSQFEAYHFVGENDVYSQFLAYARATCLEPVRQAFLKIRGNEDEHQKMAYEELVKLVGSEAQARMLIRRVRLTRLYEAWGRLSKSIRASSP
jgi:hypothetical protein